MAKLTGESNSASDVFSSLDGTKVAVSFTLDSFAAGLSGKLQNGDIISLIVLDKDTGRAVIPPAFRYVRVITTTTAGGVEQDSVVKNDDGTYSLPSTVTVLVSDLQARLLTQYEDGYTVQAALVYRGDRTVANRFIEAQDRYFSELKDEDLEALEDRNGETSRSGYDPVKRANEIINGRADSYNVEEAVKNG